MRAKCICVCWYHCQQFWEFQHNIKTYHFSGTKGEGKGKVERDGEEGGKEEEGVLESETLLGVF